MKKRENENNCLSVQIHNYNMDVYDRVISDKGQNSGTGVASSGP